MYHIFVWWYTPSSPPAPPRERWRSCRGWNYPKMKMKIIIQIPTIENPRINVSHIFWWYTPSSPPAPLGAPGGGYPKLKMGVIFEFPTI